MCGPSEPVVGKRRAERRAHTRGHWRPHTGPRGHRTVRSAHRVAGNGVVESPQLMISGRPLKPVRKFALVAATQHARCTLHAEQGAQAAACHSPDTRASCLCPTGWVWGYLVDRYVGVLCVDAILPLLLWGKRDRTTSPPSALSLLLRRSSGRLLLFAERLASRRAQQDARATVCLDGSLRG